MALPIDTFGGSAGLAQEGTWGTPVVASNYIEIVSCNLFRTIDRQPEGTLGRSGDRGRVARRKYTASDNSAGDLVTEPNYNDSFALLLLHSLGVVNTIEAPALTYTHSFTLGDLPTGLSVEKQWNAVQAEVFTGCKVGTMVFTVDSGSLAQMTTSMLAKTSGGEVAATTPTYNAAPHSIKFSDAGTLSFNGNVYDCITSVTLTLNNGIDIRPTLGSALTKEPVPTAKREITLAIDIQWTAANSLYADYQSGADSDVVITFTGANPPEALSITLHNAHISEHSNHAMQGPEIVVDNVTFMAKGGDTDLGLLIALTNLNATALVN